jgi:hypothetical protein
MASATRQEDAPDSSCERLGCGWSRAAVTSRELRGTRAEIAWKPRSDLARAHVPAHPGHQRGQAAVDVALTRGLGARSTRPRSGAARWPWQGAKRHRPGARCALRARHPGTPKVADRLAAHLRRQSRMPSGGRRRPHRNPARRHPARPRRREMAGKQAQPAVWNGLMPEQRSAWSSSGSSPPPRPRRPARALGAALEPSNAA